MWEFDRHVYGFVQKHPEFALTPYQEILGRSSIEWLFEPMEHDDASRLDGQTIMRAAGRLSPRRQSNPRFMRMPSAGSPAFARWGIHKDAPTQGLQSAQVSG
ncbi:MAG: hypothetical protein LKE92_03285 [Atopobiaceae bacterium]|jgi:hypothetical protein|nr:hypothetical protein [Atopobiaceae bacterium]